MTNKKVQYHPIQPEVLEKAAAHGNSPEAVLEVLKELDAEPGGLTPGNITDTARTLGIPAHQAYGMATFYSMLSLEERRNILRVCDGPVCWLKIMNGFSLQRGSICPLRPSVIFLLWACR